MVTASSDEILKKELFARGVKIGDAKSLSQIVSMGDRRVNFFPPVALRCLPGKTQWYGRHTFAGEMSRFEHLNGVGAFCAIAVNVKIGIAEHPTNYLGVHNIFYASVTPTGFTDDEQAFLKEREDLNRTARNKLLSTRRPKGRIGNDVWIGANVIIRKGVIIGNGAIIGAGAVVTKDVPPYAIVAGVPARLIRYRFGKDLIDRLQALKWWNLPQPMLADIDATDVEGSVSLLEERKKSSHDGRQPMVSVSWKHGSYVINESESYPADARD